MLQETSVVGLPRDVADISSYVWRGPVLQQGVEFIFELAVATKARSVFVTGSDRLQFIPLDTSTGEVHIETLPANLLKVDFLHRGSSFNRWGKRRWNAIYAAEERWADAHPDGPNLELHIHFARDHFAKGERVDWDRFAYDCGLKSEQHLQIWPIESPAVPEE